MKRLLTVSLLFAAGLLPTSLCAQPYATDDYLKLQSLLQGAMAKMAPSVVTIQTFGGTRKAPKRQPKGQPKPPGQPGRPPQRPGRKPRPKLGMTGFAQAQGATAGIVLSADGWILVSGFALNYNPTTILVQLADGRSFTAVRKGEDKSRGIAVLKIEAENLKVPEFVHPKDVKVGQWCFVLGRTFGLKDPSVHMGVVSAKDRIFGRAIQTDAYTSPANYGGPLMDVQGRIMAISVPLSASGRQAGEDLYDSGIGFGATIADIQPLIERMKQGEVLHRGYLGVATLPSHLGPGAKLSRVQKKSPAHNAGLRKGDTILEIDKVKVANSFHLQMLVGSKMVGDPVAVKYKKRRGGDIISVTVFLEKVGAAQMKPKKKEESDTRLPWEEEEEEGKGKDDGDDGK
ncbi:MAG: S1C family serine protease [Planctomycetota bacterium]|jgi:serine protease Do